MLQSCLYESAISLPKEKLDQLTLALFESADKDCSGTITFEELRDELQRFPGVLENLTIRYRPVWCRDTARAGIRPQLRSVARAQGRSLGLARPRPGRPCPAPPLGFPPWSSLAPLPAFSWGQRSVLPSAGQLLS